MKKSLLFIAAIAVASSMYAQKGSYLGTPYLGTAMTIPGNIPAWKFDDGGSDTAYHYRETVRQGAFDTRAPELVGIESPQGFTQIGWFHGVWPNDAPGTIGSWVKYTINVQTAGTYELKVHFRTGANEPIIIKFNFETLSGTTTTDETSFQSAHTSTSGEFQFWKTTDGWNDPDGPDTIVTKDIVLTAGIKVFTVENTGQGDINFQGFGLYNTAGINNIDKSNINMSVYPNPANDYVKVDFDNAKNEATNVVVADITGKQVIKTIETGNYVNINTSNLSNGIYFVTVRNNSGVATKKFVKASN